MDTVANLQAAIHGRWRPEDVLKNVLALPGTGLRPKQTNVIKPHACTSWPTLMETEFRNVTDMRDQLKVASDLFPQVTPVPAPDDAAAIQTYIATLRGLLGLSMLDFKDGRLNRQQRVTNAAVPWNSHYSYNKRVRLVLRMADKAKRIEDAALLFRMEQTAKTKLAYQLVKEDVTHPATLAFIAYFVSRLGVRSAFTNTSQKRAFDEVSDILMEKCKEDYHTNWFQIAHVYQGEGVLNKLTDAQKGELLGKFYEVMVLASTFLKELDDNSIIDHQNLVVQRGNDSSTWNAAAGAFNKARDAWIAMLYEMGREDLLDAICPGKALRLMAADVVRWHGGYVEPNTAVYRLLPRPWEVVLGQKICDRTDIETALDKVHADPKTRSGWVKPRGKYVENTAPTPDMVHGIAIGSPYMALALRKAGVYSGQKIKQGHEATVEAAADIIAASRPQ